MLSARKKLPNRHLLALSLVLLAVTTVQGATVDPAATEFFEKKVRPVLADNCFRCHSSQAAKLRGNFNLECRAGLLKGGNDGPAVVPGDPEHSPLIAAIRQLDAETAMPPKGKLSQAAVADLTQWVKMGAPWPGEMDAPAVGAVATTAPAHDPTAAYDRLRKTLWSWQPISHPALPISTQEAWAKTDIDRFVLARLDQKGLTPSAPADKVTLIRRATFDLTGLPPTPKEIDNFVHDAALDAFERVIDRLLASPQFGQRWGRHWLDVARYGESTGMTRNLPFYYAWRYRDYVIASFNADKPYNRFLTVQLAGDLLPTATPAEHDQNLIATGFLALGPKDLNEKDARQFVMNNVDEQIDVTGRAILATTISCARCHDHKFDPIPTSQYYALAGIFKSTQLMTGLSRVRGGMPQQFFHADGLVKLSGYVESPADAAEAAPATNGKVGKGMLAAFRPLKVEAVAMGVSDLPSPMNTHILGRGDLDNVGAIVPRGFLTIPCMTISPKIDPHHSGRLELAEWLTQRDNPLTTRVIVNRIWRHLFGQGIVRTVDNFGASGEMPSDPELLDYLATRFVADGWSIKKTIRAIMLSAAYQQASSFDHARYAIDPDNRLFWRQSQRRLEAESIRDAILASAGDLQPGLMTGSDVMKMPPGEVRRAARRGMQFDAEQAVRSVYLPIYRSNLPEVLEAFDEADPDYVTGDREVTTVAPQALYMMNDPFVLGQAGKMSVRLQTEAQGLQPRIELAYRLTLGRAPSSTERARAVAFVNSFARQDSSARSSEGDALAAFCQALFASAEFRYLN